MCEERREGKDLAPSGFNVCEWWLVMVSMQGVW